MIAGQGFDQHIIFHGQNPSGTAYVTANSDEHATGQGSFRNACFD